jgi:hypothetical protein
MARLGEEDGPDAQANPVHPLQSIRDLDSKAEN